MRRRILVVDDDRLLRTSLALNLEQMCFNVQTAGSAEEGLTLAARLAPDLVVLDVGLPGMDGLDALREFRSVHKAPVILVSARCRGLDQVIGLELGADDYVTKPFEFDVLLARIRAALRGPRGNAERSTRTIVVGDLVIDPAAHVVHVGDRRLELRPREFALLRTLASEAGTVVPTEELVLRVWGPDFEGESQTVYVHVRWLREKLESDPCRPERIVTVRRVGYKLVAQSWAPTAAVELNSA